MTTTRLATALEAVATLIGREGEVNNITRIWEMPGNDIVTVYGRLSPGAAPAAWCTLPSEGWPRYTRNIGGLDVVFVDDGGRGQLSAHHLRKLAALNPSQISYHSGERRVLLGGVTQEQANLVREEFCSDNLEIASWED